MRQIAGRGVFVHIELEVVDLRQPPQRITMANEVESWEGDHYLPAVKVGVGYAQTIMARDQKLWTPFEVIVRRLLTSTVDTHEMLVVFAAARAVLTVFDHDPKDAVEFDLEHGRLVFAV